MKIFQKVLAGYFFETPCALVYIDGVVYCVRCRGLTGVGALNLARGQVSGWAFDRGAGDRGHLIGGHMTCTFILPILRLVPAYRYCFWVQKACVCVSVHQNGPIYFW